MCLLGLCNGGLGLVQLVGEFPDLVGGLPVFLFGSRQLCFILLNGLFLVTHDAVQPFERGLELVGIRDGVDVCALQHVELGGLFTDGLLCLGQRPLLCEQIVLVLLDPFGVLPVRLGQLSDLGFITCDVLLLVLQFGVEEFEFRTKTLGRIIPIIHSGGCRFELRLSLTDSLLGLMETRLQVRHIEFHRNADNIVTSSCHSYHLPYLV